MSGILIYGSYGQYFSFAAADDIVYDFMRKEISSNPNNKVVFDKEKISLAQIDNATESVAGIVKRLTSGEEVNAEKELSNFFS